MRHGTKSWITCDGTQKQRAIQRGIYRKVAGERGKNIKQSINHMEITIKPREINEKTGKFEYWGFFGYFAEKIRLISERNSRKLMNVKPGMKSGRKRGDHRDYGLDGFENRIKTRKIGKNKGKDSDWALKQGNMHFSAGTREKGVISARILRIFGRNVEVFVMNSRLGRSQRIWIHSEWGKGENWGLCTLGGLGGDESEFSLRK